MTNETVAFLNELEAFAQRAFAKGGQYALVRSGTIPFAGESVYFTKSTRHPEVVLLKVFGEEFDVVLHRD